MRGRAVAGAASAALVRRTPGRVPWPPLLCSVGAASAAVAVPVATRGQGAALSVEIAGLALAAAAGYLLDDPAAAVTSTVPRPLWRRRSATVVRGLTVLAASWTLLLALLEWRGSGLSAIPATIQTAVTALLALSAAAMLARAGEQEPGNLVGSAVVLTGVGGLLAQPLLGVTIFLRVDSMDEQATSSLAWWAAVGLAAAVVLLAASRDPASRRTRS